MCHRRTFRKLFKKVQEGGGGSKSDSKAFAEYFVVGQREEIGEIVLMIARKREREKERERKGGRL
jgi:hypothetical protein